MDIITRRRLKGMIHNVHGDECYFDLPVGTQGYIIERTSGDMVFAHFDCLADYGIARVAVGHADYSVIGANPNEPTPKKSRRKLPRYRRAQVLARDKYTCQHCLACDPPTNGKPDYTWLKTHHILPVSKGGLDNLDNLISLCHYCHMVEHRRLKKAETS